MIVVRELAAMREHAAEWRRKGATSGFVPTMGALHAGHLSLVAAARRSRRRVAVSVFVNPLQFGPAEDFARYPRTEAEDLEALASAGVDLAFLPRAEALYPADSETRVVPGAVAQDLEGALRPGHFAGVCTVVLKLFSLVQPDEAWFGAKDAQQLAVIRRMARDLDLPLAIRAGATIREPDGLALSSRNRFLDADERVRALALIAALRALRAEYEAGARRRETLLEAGRAHLAVPGLAVDYLEIRDPVSFRAVGDPVAGGVALVAARVGATRLIDNVPLGPEARRLLGEEP